MYSKSPSIRHSSKRNIFSHFCLHLSAALSRLFFLFAFLKDFFLFIYLFKQKHKITEKKNFVKICASVNVRWRHTHISCLSGRTLFTLHWGQAGRNIFFHFRSVPRRKRWEKRDSKISVKLRQRIRANYKLLVAQAIKLATQRCTFL